MTTNKKYQIQVSLFTPRIGKPKSFTSCVGPIRRFQYLIEKTDWDKDLLKFEKWIKLVCWIVIAVSVLFFVPVSLSVVLW